MLVCSYANTHHRFRRVILGLHLGLGLRAAYARFAFIEARYSVGFIEVSLRCFRHLFELAPLRLPHGGAHP